MKLTEKQTGVLKGIIIGMSIAVAIIFIGSYFNPFYFSESSSEFDRLEIAIKSALFPAIFLVISVGRLAKHRFFTPEDIDGGGFSEDTEHARILQSLLQNTLEQFCIAFAAYLAWAIVMPATWMSVIPLAAIAFAIGRVMFFSGYKKGAPSRAVGFTLTFYPSVLMLICAISTTIWQFFS
jgi:uncharacterized membrane protein YecN with MAPEG domain